MLLCEHYQAGSGNITRVSEGDVAAKLEEKDSLLWIDMQHPSDVDFAWLQQTFNFHPLAIEDAKNQRQRAKVDRYPGYYFIVMRAIHPHARGQSESSQINLFVGSNYLVSIHRGDIPAIDQARKRWEESHLPSEATSYLFYLISDVIVDSYFPIIDKIGDAIDSLDTAIFATQTNEAIEKVFQYRRNLLAIRKILVPLRDAFNELIRAEEGGRIFPIEQTRAFFGDVYDHILRLVDFVDTYRDMLSSSIDAFQSAQANRLNENMQRLTVGATVLATSTVITGFFGMNVRGLLINSAWPYGGEAILVGMLLVMLIEIWIFQRKGWL